MGLLRTTAQGMVWTTISTVIRSFVQLFQVAILTRYLAKSDFGIIAIATLFIGFTQIFIDLGLSSGIMHKQDTNPKQYSSLFWLNIISGVFLTTLLIALTPLISHFYNEPSLVKILSLLSLTILFSSFGIQHKTVQQKELRFKYISIVEIISSVLSMIIAVVLAEKGFGVFSLVYSTLFNSLCSNVLFLFIGLFKDRNISLHFNFKETYPYLKIGAFSMGTNILDFFSREIDVVFISVAFGNEILGVYSLCKKFVGFIYGAINPILTKVITPLFAKLQKDISQTRRVYYTIVESLALTNFPIFFFVAVFSYGIIDVLYGSKYINAAPIMSLLAVYYGYLSIGNPIGSLQVALGRTDSGFYWTICRIILNVLASYIGTKFNIMLLVFCLFFISLLSSPLAWKITIQPLIHGSFLEYFFKAFKPFCIICVVSFPFYVFF